MKIVIDADACPRNALLIAYELGRKYSLEVWTIASFSHNIEGDHHITTGNSPQEADLKVINTAQGGDIAVTQDWGLAAMLLGKKVKCLSPHGRIYRDEKIDFLMEERNLKARFRRGGGRTKGPAKRTAADDETFRRSLELLIKQSERDGF